MLERPAKTRQDKKKDDYFMVNKKKRTNAEIQIFKYSNIQTFKHSRMKFSILFLQLPELIKSDKRAIVTNNNKPISTVSEANVLGNVWEITATTVGDSTRLAGGSLFCSVNTCHGTSKDREQFIDKQTGNIHIGFAVIRSSQH